jgi:hypothetical protein
MGIFDKFGIFKEIKDSAYTTCVSIFKEFNMVDSKIYFDDCCIYTDENGIKYQIESITMNKYNEVTVTIDGKDIELRDNNIAICTLIEIKMKGYATAFVTA